jgi:hypothetical protein
MIRALIAMSLLGAAYAAFTALFRDKPCAGNCGACQGSCRAAGGGGHNEED